ncbi:MAG TPA: hypothetical protein VN429_04645 [Methanospirillum sp.]|jgi:hypothetical protein|uniref:hypothetical protein n=1 Tax=Methanospirillum sp. TaxID=45200 RepID=UPI002C732D7C|nr:hypothetical protein [Methanospirillum sp.]HWQ63685.1 hypothetical protein [Methanospirillum sp.]
MVALGERFLYASEIAGALVIGLVFIGTALSGNTAADLKWKLIIGAVICFSFSLVFFVMYTNSKKERLRKRIS